MVIKVRDDKKVIRKLRAILSADVKGYRITGQHEQAIKVAKRSIDIDPLAYVSPGGYKSGRGRNW